MSDLMKKGHEVCEKRFGARALMPGHQRPVRSSFPAPSNGCPPSTHMLIIVCVKLRGQCPSAPPPPLGRVQ